MDKIILIFFLIFLIILLNFKINENFKTYKNNIEIVISRYNEKLDWINDNPFNKYSLIIYNKGNNQEFIKTDKNGQFSFFTINPKSTRGIHYHHTKSEKFLILKGCVLFKAKNLLNQEIWEKEVEDVSCEVIESIPGWVHSLENIGQDVAIVILWSNEIFNNEKPDTYQSL